MKRSEMVKLMVETAKYHDGGYLEPYVAYILLSNMEEAGMLPPKRPDEHPLGYGAAWLSDEEVEKNYFKFKHSWEPEDA